MARPRRLPIVLAVLAVAAAVGVTGVARSPAPASARDYLGAATNAVARSHAWWDPTRGWYLERIGPGAPRSLATLWGVVHLFEATDAIALADPTPQNIAAVRTFAAGAERYWNPNLQPVPGYAASPGTTDPHHRTWYDDNGWWGMAFYDAYRATGDPAYLDSTKRALAFVDSGWDPAKGGIWWETTRSFHAGESLAGGTLLAATLYHATKDPRYLAMARKYLSWADRADRGRDGLYDRNEYDTTPMPYVEGPMAVALVQLGQDTGSRSYVAEGERLADTAAGRFRHLTMGPQYDAMYIRALVELYRLDGNRRWYRLARAVVDRAMDRARARNGIYTRTWDGRPVSTIKTPPGKLQIHAATAAAIAWIAAAGR